MASTNTSKHKAAFEAALKNMAKAHRSRLTAAYEELKRNCLESRYDAAGLSVGKFCEAALRSLQERTLLAFTPYGTKIANFADEARKIVNSSTANATESERTIIPRALVFMYTMRNKRGIGHLGGDVDANSIDISMMAKGADWVMCELIRIHHGLSLEEAQDLVDALNVRQLPQIWEIGGKKRVLETGLTAKEETLLLLYHTVDSAVMVEDLIEWVEYSNASVFRKSVLAPLHSSRLVEWDRESEWVALSPKGVVHVETMLNKKVDSAR